MRKTEQFRQQVARPKALGPETNPWYWHPFRASVVFAPDDFLRKLKEVGPELSCTWNPIDERWIVWVRSPRFAHKLCWGWKLLFVNQDADGSYLPLDERVFARLYKASVMEHGSAKEYFARVMAEIERDKEKREKDRMQETIDLAMPAWEHSQIKVAMRGKSSGSKFSTYHS